MERLESGELFIWVEDEMFEIFDSQQYSLVQVHQEFIAEIFS